MKRLALAIATLGSLAVMSFAGPPEPKEVVAPPPPPPLSYFRGNEFDIGIFATYVTGTNGGGEQGQPILPTAMSSGSPAAAALTVGVEAWILLISSLGNI
jgi:hypothetical protein